MDFANALKNESAKTYTENGALALNTTGTKCLDLFGSIGALRSRSTIEVERLFADAYAEDKLLATKILFYARDILEGLGERKVFRDLLSYCAKYHPEAIENNLDLIGAYGRYDDLYSLINTPLEDKMWSVMKDQFEDDRKNMAKGNSISLLAKWIKTPDASSLKTRALGILTAKNLEYSVYEFKRILRALRKHIGIVERYMSAGEWDKIKYPEVPSRAMMIYHHAFMKHDEYRFSEFVRKAINGDVKVNSKTLYPYDIVEKVAHTYDTSSMDLLEAQWKQLPNYVEPGTNAIVMADVSGSMNGRPMWTSIGLAMYFAERNIGAYHNLFMTFSENPEVITLKGETLKQKFTVVHNADWGVNTDLEAAFNKVLEIAITNHVPAEEMVKSIIVVSDMEIDSATGNYGYYSYFGGREKPKTSDWLFYDLMKSNYEQYGYQIPNVVFWNVNSRNDVFHADATRKGVQLLSGSSVTTFKQLVGSIGLTPVEMMLKVINTKRYEPITIKD